MVDQEKSIKWPPVHYIRPSGFYRCAIVGADVPDWVQKIDIPKQVFLNLAEGDQDVPPLVILVAADPDDLNDQMVFLDETAENYRPYVIVTGAIDPVRALWRGGDFFIDPDEDPDIAFAQIKAIERRFEAAQRCVDKLKNVTQKLTKVQADFDAVDVEMAEARKLQNALVKGQTISFPIGEMSLFTRPFRHISGDLVGHFPAGTNKIGFFAIDVAGHGVTAAMLTARIAGMLLGGSPDTNLALRKSRNGTQPHRPSRVITQMNALLFKDFETDHYFTCILGILDTTTGAIIFSQAGHPNPILLTKRGTSQSIGMGGLPVGLIPHAEFTDQQLHLSKGDRLVLYSDGFSECIGQQFGHQLGEAGFTKLLLQHQSADVSSMFERVLNDLSGFHGRQRFEDDISGIAIDYQTTPKKDRTASRSPAFARQ